MTAMWQKAAKAARTGAASGDMSRRRRCRAGCRAETHQEIGGLLVSLRHHQSCRSKTA